MVAAGVQFCEVIETEAKVEVVTEDEGYHEAIETLVAAQLEMVVGVGAEAVKEFKVQEEEQQ
jgi:hypothetical protein